jgi:hypothetical protein
VGETIDQEVVVTRRSAYRVLGGEFGEPARYGFVSRLKVTAILPDGGLTASQTIEATRLLECSPASRDAFVAALRQAQGTSFELAVNPAGEITEIRGFRDPIQVLQEKGAAGRPNFRVWSLLDADGWRELAGLTFFQPGVPLRPRANWTRRIHHDWGPMGSWNGLTTYTAAGPRAGQERIDYRHELTYRPPQKGDGGPPVQVLRATFEPVAAGGTILYDPVRGRATAAEEMFRVKGVATVTVEGVEAAVEMEELQGFELRIVKPMAGVMSGQPPSSRPRQK